MNFRTIKIGKNYLLKPNNLNITIGRNYYCEFLYSLIYLSI